MKRIWLYIMLLAFAACVKEAEWETPDQISEYVVVDGIITNESRLQHLYLNYNKADLNGAIRPLNGADVILNNEDSTWRLYEDSVEAGKYVSNSSFVAQLNRTYSLLILHQGKFYSSQAYMVQGKTFAELSYKKNDDNDLYHIDYVASAFEEEDPAMWEILIDWSSVPGYENVNPDDVRKRLLFYTLTTLDVSQIFAPLVEEISFPAGTKIDQRRYSLSPEHAEFVRSMLLETSWQGGVFPTDPANVVTNISAGAIGYFGISAVNSLSLTVTP